MANKEKLYATLQVIKDNLSRWDQAEWASGLVNTDTKDWKECGTSFCFAGWACVLEGWRPVADVYSHATTEIYLPGTDHICHYSGVAKCILDLTWQEADALFDEDNNLNDLEQIVEEITKDG